MIRTMLLAIDGFAESAAAPSAIALAERFGARITVLGAVDTPWMTRPGSRSGQLEDVRKRVQAALREVGAAAADRVSATLLQREGYPDDLIAAEASGHDLVVIGRNTSFRPGGGALSPQLKAIVRASPRPVLVVADAVSMGERLLVACDGSVPASRAVHMAALLGLARNGRTQVLTVNSVASVAGWLAEQTARLLRNHGGDATAFGIESVVDPAELILSHSRTFGADMVVMGAYGLGGLRDTIFGSATSRLLADGAAALFLHP